MTIVDSAVGYIPYENGPGYIGIVGHLDMAEEENDRDFPLSITSKRGTVIRVRCLR